MGGPASPWRPTTPTEVVVTTAIDQAVVAVGPTPAVVELQLPDKAEDVINSVGGVLYEGWFAGDRGYLELDRGQYDDPAEVFSWSGAAVLLRAAYLRDVGRFNPAFFLYYEDLELSWRGRLRGWRYRTVPDSVVRHRHGFTTGHRQRAVPSLGGPQPLDDPGRVGPLAGGAAGRRRRRAPRPGEG